MIEIVNPGWLSFFVDEGRHGYAHIGVPPSAALDQYALHMVNRLAGNPPNTPALEVIGSPFAFAAACDMGCVITGGRVKALVGDKPAMPWTLFPVPAGSLVTVTAVEEGFRYYVGFTGTVNLKWAMKSRTTNLECRFGGFEGRPLMKGDMLDLSDVRLCVEGRASAGVVTTPVMDPPHVLRVLEGPEMGSFTKASVERFFAGKGEAGFTVSARINRAGIRLDGAPLVFRAGAERSIISEGILPGTIQVPGDGLPIIMLHERTVGGYVRAAMVAKVDRDLLAHLKPKDRVVMKLIGIEEAEGLWRESLVDLWKGPGAFRV